MIRLIALDVDGTLLDSAHRLPPANAEAVRAALDRGIAVVLATGKQYSAARDLIHGLGLTAPQITSHGALITDPATDSPILLQGVPRAAGERALEVGTAVGITMIIAGDGRTYARERNADIEYMLTYGDPEPQLMADLAAALEPPPTHLMAIAYRRDAVYAAAEDAFNAALNGALAVSRSSPYYLELLHPEVSKGNALRIVCDRLGIDPAEVLAVGDSFNDLSLFAAAGVSAAMGHARPEVRAAASHIAPDNDSAGVAWAIQTLALDR